MRKMIYIITGFLTSLILFVFLFVETPEVEKVKKDPIDFNIDENLEFTDLRNVPSNNSTIFAGGTYQLSQAQIDRYENMEVVKYGKYNPMFMYKHENAPPVVEEPTDNSISLSDTDNSQDEDITGGTLIPLEDIKELEGLNIKKSDIEKVSVIEKVEVADALFDFVNTGKLPVDSEYSNSISSKFGIRKDPFDGKDAFHSGVDFAGSDIDGKNVYAVSHGKVLEIIESDKGYGNHIIVQHNGYQSVYAHLSLFGNIKVGERIKAGTTIGKVGSTGRSTGPHLHFEIRVNDVAIDPLVFISQLRKGE